MEKYLKSLIYDFMYHACTMIFDITSNTLHLLTVIVHFKFMY